MKPPAARNSPLPPHLRWRKPQPFHTLASKEILMQSKKQKQAARKPSRTVKAPRVVRAQDAATADSGAIRFGTGMAPAALRK